LLVEQRDWSSDVCSSDLVWVCNRHLFLGCSEIKTSYRPHPEGGGLISDINKLNLV
jgi:hypothetical protein